MCPTNSKTHLCYHPISALRPLLLSPQPSSPAPRPEAIFCLGVVQATLSCLSSLAPAPDPARLDLVLSDMRPGSALPECLVAAGVFAPLYLNGPELFVAGLRVYAAGLRRWVDVCVAEGVLAQQRRRETGDGDDDAAGAGWCWAWSWEGKGDVGAWVREKVWKPARLAILEDMVHSVPDDASSMTAAQVEILQEIRDLDPERFLKSAPTWPSLPPPPPRQQQTPTWPLPPPPPPPPHQQQTQVLPPPSTPATTQTQQQLKMMESLAGQQVMHMAATHRKHLMLDDHARVMATRRYMEKSTDTLLSGEDDGMEDLLDIYNGKR